MIDVVLSYYIHPESDCAYVDIVGLGGMGDGNVMEIGDVEPDSTAAVKVPSQLDFVRACVAMGMQPPYYKLDTTMRPFGDWCSPTSPFDRSRRSGMPIRDCGRCAAGRPIPWSTRWPYRRAASIGLVEEWR